MDALNIQAFVLIKTLTQKPNSEVSDNGDSDFK